MAVPAVPTLETVGADGAEGAVTLVVVGAPKYVQNSSSKFSAVDATTSLSGYSASPFTTPVIAGTPRKSSRSMRFMPDLPGSNDTSEKHRETDTACPGTPEGSIAIPALVINPGFTFG